MDKENTEKYSNIKAARSNQGVLMKKVVLSLVICLVAMSAIFARSPNAVENIELDFVYEVEARLEKQLDSEYTIVKIHPSETGKNYLQEEFIRDILITQNIDGKDKEVCLIYPYFAGNEPGDLTAALPIKIVLDNKDKDFKKTNEKSLEMCFAVKTNDKLLLEAVNKIVEDAAFIERIYESIFEELAKDYFKDKISVESVN